MWIDSRAKKHRLTHCAAIISRPSVYTENYDIATQAWEYPLVQQEFPGEHGYRPQPSVA